VNVAALAVGVFAAAIALFSLGWQIRTWRDSGPKVSTFVHRAPFFRRLPNGDMQPVDGPGTLTISVVNKGRMAAQIAVYGFHLSSSNGMTIFPPRSSLVAPAGSVLARPS
jgi:hypothetical protein